MKNRKSKHTGIVLAELSEGRRCCYHRTEKMVRRDTDLDWITFTNVSSWFVLVNFSANRWNFIHTTMQRAKSEFQRAWVSVELL